MVFNFLKQTKKDHLPEREVVQINGENIIFNSRGLIPAIILKIERKKTEVIDLIYMNPESLDLSIKSGEVYTYRRSTGQIERLGMESETGYRIESIKLGKRHRSLLITVAADDKLKDNQCFKIELFKK
jgi:phosphoribosyl-AMP cyclohydrolase